MSPFCVMCDALGHSACISGCYYTSLVAQGVVTPVQLKLIIGYLKSSYIHNRMTSAAEHDRAALMEMFWYQTWGRMVNPNGGFLGLEDELMEAQLAELNAAYQKLEAEIAERKEVKEGMLAELTALETELAKRKEETEAVIAELTALGADAPVP